MQENWKNWCRLCGSSEITIKLEGSLTLQYHFKITENNIKICAECNSYVSGFEEFLGRSENVQALFQELSNSAESLNLKKLNELRSKFNLRVIEVPTKTEDFETDFKDEKQEGEENLSDHEFNFDHLHDQFSNDSDSNTEAKQEIEPEIHYIPEAPIVEEPIKRPKRSKYRRRTKKSLYKEYSDEEEEIKTKKDPDYVPEDEEAPKSSKKNPKTINPYAKNEDTPKKKAKEKPKVQIGQYLQTICHICQESCSSMPVLERHTKELHDCRPNVFCICGYTINNQWTYSKHKKRCFGHLEAHYQCDLCRQRYYTKRDIEKHMQLKHMKDSKKFLCTTCGREFKFKNSLTTHELIHLPEELREKFPCTFCDFTSISKNVIRLHIQKHTGIEKNFTCNLCGKSYASKHTLNSHMEIHKTTYDFSCHLCATKFKTKGSLKSHMKAHGPKSYICKVCGMGFRRGSLLTKHMSVHSDARPFVCHYIECGKAFKRKKALEDHITSIAHLNIQKYLCDICEMPFHSASNRRRHKRQMHPVEYEIELKEKAAKKMFVNTSIVDRRFEKEVS